MFRWGHITTNLKKYVFWYYVHHIRNGDSSLRTVGEPFSAPLRADLHSWNKQSVHTGSFIYSLATNHHVLQSDHHTMKQYHQSIIQLMYEDLT